MRYLLLIIAALLCAGCGHHTTAPPASKSEQVGAPALAPVSIPSAAG